MSSRALARIARTPASNKGEEEEMEKTEGEAKDTPANNKPGPHKTPRITSTHTIIIRRHTTLLFYGMGQWLLRVPQQHSW